MLDQIQMFLELSNIEERLPSIRRVKFSPDGKSNIQIGVISRFSENQLRGQNEISGLLMFTVLDALLDQWFPGMEGESFKVRYKNLLQITTRERIIAGVYRVMRLMRNALVHDRQAVRAEADKTIIELQHPRGVSRLTYRAPAVVYLNTLILLLLKTRNHDDNYIRGMLAGYYERFMSEIVELIDDIPEPLPVHDCLYPFKPFVRYRVEETIMPPGDWQVHQIKRHRLSDFEADWAFDEILIHQANKIYLVPGEFLGDQENIHRSLLKNWEISPNHPFLNW